MITKHDVRRLLESGRLFSAGSVRLDDDSELHLDSMSLTWLLTVIEREYGISIGVEDVDPNQLTSIDRIHGWLASAQSARS